jgi:hypothetical protein
MPLSVLIYVHLHLYSNNTHDSQVSLIQSDLSVTDYIDNLRTYSEK